jgi:hypothetical protein
MCGRMAHFKCLIIIQFPIAFYWLLNCLPCAIFLSSSSSLVLLWIKHYIVRILCFLGSYYAKVFLWTNSHQSPSRLCAHFPAHELCWTINFYYISIVYIHRIFCSFSSAMLYFDALREFAFTSTDFFIAFIASSFYVYMSILIPFLCSFFVHIRGLITLNGRLLFNL